MKQKQKEPFNLNRRRTQTNLLAFLFLSLHCSIVLCDKTSIVIPLTSSSTEDSLAFGHRHRELEATDIPTETILSDCTTYLSSQKRLKRKEYTNYILEKMIQMILECPNEVYSQQLLNVSILEAAITSKEDVKYNVKIYPKWSNVVPLTTLSIFSSYACKYYNGENNDIRSFCDKFFKPNGDDPDMITIRTAKKVPPKIFILFQEIRDDDVVEKISRKLCKRISLDFGVILTNVLDYYTKEGMIIVEDIGSAQENQTGNNYAEKIDQSWNDPSLPDNNSTSKLVHEMLLVDIDFIIRAESLLPVSQLKLVLKEELEQIARTQLSLRKRYRKQVDSTYHDEETNVAGRFLKTDDGHADDNADPELVNVKVQLFPIGKRSNSICHSCTLYFRVIGFF